MTSQTFNVPDVQMPVPSVFKQQHPIIINDSTVPDESYLTFYSNFFKAPFISYSEKYFKSIFKNPIVGNYHNARFGFRVTFSPQEKDLSLKIIEVLKENFVKKAKVKFSSKAEEAIQNGFNSYFEKRQQASYYTNKAFEDKGFGSLHVFNISGVGNVKLFAVVFYSDATEITEVVMLGLEEEPGIYEFV